MINSFEQSIKKMTRFGDLIGGKETVVTPITTPQPVVEEPPRPCLLYTSDAADDW